MLTLEDARVAYDELRLQSLGFWRGRVVFLVWTERGPAVHLISCRNANKRETKDYFAAVQP